MENKNDTISPANGDETSSVRATKDLMDGFLSDLDRLMTRRHNVFPSD
jgi:hypothetical protein